MSLLKMIAQYERETENYIRELEEKVKRLEQEAFNNTTLLMAGERAREQLLLHSIMNGAFDKDKIEAIRAAKAAASEDLSHVEGLTAEG